MSRSAAALAAVALVACQGSDPQPLEPVSLDPLGGAASLVDGGAGSTLTGYTVTDGTPASTVRLVRQEASAPDRAALVGDVRFAGAGRITRLRVGEAAAAVLLGGVAWVIDATSPSLPASPLPTPAGAVDLAVSGRWVALVIERGLHLVHLDRPEAPVPWEASGTPTAVLATPTGFLAFTATGVLVVDTTGPAPDFREADDPLLAGVQAGAVAGGGAMVAGPAATAGWSRVLRLDLSDPAAPAVVASHEVPGRLVAFAWDGVATSVVAVHGEGDGAAPEAFHQGWLVRESGGGLRHEGVPLPFWSTSAQPLAARDGHLHAAQAGAVAFLRIR